MDQTCCLLMFLALYTSVLSSYHYHNGTLPCKLFNEVELDCSHRKLTTIPSFGKASPTSTFITLDLSSNMLQNVSGQPFRNFASVKLLNLSRNVISFIDADSFIGLQLLQTLDLSKNKVEFGLSLYDGAFNGLTSLHTLILRSTPAAGLSKDVFQGVHALEVLDMFQRYGQFIPQNTFDHLQNLKHLEMSIGDTESLTQLFAPLNLLQKLRVEYHSISFETLSFENLTNLSELHFSMGTFLLFLYPYSFERAFSNLQLNIFLFKAFELVPYRSVVNVFWPFQHLSSLELTASSSVIAGLEYLDSQLLHLCLNIYIPSFIPVAIWPFSHGGFNEQTFKSLAKFNSSLRYLEIIGHIYNLDYKEIETIQGPTVAWVSSLEALTVKRLGLRYLTKDVFDGLSHLQKLDLSNNNFVAVPLEALMVFQKYHSLHYLNLGENKIASLFQNLKIVNSESLQHPSVTRSKLPSVTMNLIRSLTELHLEELNEPTIEVHRPLSSLRKLRMPRKSTGKAVILNPLCSGSQQLEHLELKNWKLLGEDSFDSGLNQINFHKSFGNKCLHLKFLDISGTQMNRVHQDDVYMQKLETFKASENKLTSITDITFIKTQTLAYLDLSYNEIQTVNRNEDMLILVNLTYLNLESNRIATLSGLYNLNVIQTLNLAKNVLSEVPRSWLKNDHNKKPQLKT